MNQARRNGSARARSPGSTDAELGLLRQVFDGLPVGLGLFDASDEFRFEYANPGLERLLGLQTSPEVGKPAGEVFRKAEQQKILQLFRAVRSSGQPRGTFAADRGPADAAGNVGIWNLDLYPVRDGGGNQVTHIVAVAQETFEKLGGRERQEQEALTLRQKNQQLADLEKAKSQFLSLASHELRGPAATLRGYLAMLEDGSLGVVPDPIQRVLPLLRAKAGQINMLASEMVEAARLEDRRLQLKLRPVDLAEVITQNIEQVRQTAEAKHHITLDAPMASPVWVLGDAMRLDIIVANLLDNAVKYSPAGGEIKCELAVAEGLALFTVRDHGIGISLEDMPRLFIRFSRLASARLSDVPGTGLGLYLGRELARLHGGDILAISKLDEGSEFTLSIPLKLDEG